MQCLYGFIYGVLIYLFNCFVLSGYFFLANTFMMALYISFVAISIFVMSRHYSEVRSICYASLVNVKFFSGIKLIVLACISSFTAILYCVNVSLQSCNIIRDWRIAAILPIILLVSIAVCNRFYKEWGRLSKSIQKSIVVMACISALIVSSISVYNFHKINEYFSKMEAVAHSETSKDLFFSSLLSNIIPLYGVYSDVKIYNRYSDLDEKQRKYNPYYTTLGDLVKAASAIPEKASSIAFTARIMVFFDVFFNWLANILGKFGLFILFFQEFSGEFFLASIYCMQLMLWQVPFGSVHEKYCEVYGKDPVPVEKLYKSNVKFFVFIYIFVFYVLNITLFS